MKRLFVLTVYLGVLCLAATSTVINPITNGQLTNALDCNNQSLNNVPNVWPKSNGGTGTASPSLVAGSNVTITGSWPNQTIASAGGGGGGSITSWSFNNANGFLGSVTNPSTTPVLTLSLGDSVDTSKIAKFDVHNVSTSTTRTITVPDHDTILPQPIVAPTHNFITGLNFPNGNLTYGQPGFSDLSGSISTSQIPNTAVSPGSYVLSSITVDAQGRVTSASSGVSNGYWDSTVEVSGMDATTTSTSLVNITGLTFSAAINSVYEIEADLFCSTSADTSGMKFGVQYSAAGASVGATTTGTFTSSSAGSSSIVALNSATSNTYLTTGSQLGDLTIKGHVTTGANTGNITIQFLKVSSGTATVKIGSVLKVKKM